MSEELIQKLAARQVQIQAHMYFWATPSLSRLTGGKFVVLFVINSLTKIHAQLQHSLGQRVNGVEHTHPLHNQIIQETQSFSPQTLLWVYNH